jgi:ABC-2 type transport system ATP-binding protein
MRNTVIRTENLTKVQGAERWLAPLTFDVEPGEVFGFLGGPKAGKSTFVRILMGYLRPTAGDAYVLGMDIRRKNLEIHRRVGYAPQDPHFYEHLNAAQMLAYLAGLHGAVAPDEMKSIAGCLGLDLGQPLAAMDAAERQKLNLTQACMHHPDLLLLDEPYRWLDSAAAQALNRIIADARAEGRAVFVASQNQAEIGRVCDRVGVLREGRLLSVERVIQFKSRLLRKIEIRFAEQVPLELFSAIPNVQNLSLERAILRCTVKGDPDRLIKTAGQFRVADLISHEPNVEEIFQAYYEEAPYAA